MITAGNEAHDGVIEGLVYHRVGESAAVMMNAIEGSQLIPEVTDDYLEDVKQVILASERKDNTGEE